MTSTLDAFAVLSGLLGVRAFGRMLATSAGDPIPVDPNLVPGGALVSAIVPVLDEAERLGPALASLCAQPGALREIVVVDGGSSDGTRDLVREFAARDPRVRLIESSPRPAGWNGKAWNLACGLNATTPASRWIVTMDADVRLEPHAIASLVAFARTAYLDAFSAAPLLELSGAGEALLHPAFLATLIYRYGLPGNVARSPRDVLANGQLFFARRQLLVESDAIGFARASRSEDVTIARALVAYGANVGFFEGGRLARVQMYRSFDECARNWPRSLGLDDRTTSGTSLALQLGSLALVAALPLWFSLAALAAGRANTLFFRVNAILAIARFAVLAGSRRAYEAPAYSYWLAPFFDAFALVAIARAATSRQAQWRGQPLVERA